jgi:hypothetical protein
VESEHGARIRIQGNGRKSDVKRQPLRQRRKQGITLTCILRRQAVVVKVGWNWLRIIGYLMTEFNINGVKT